MGYHNNLPSSKAQAIITERGESYGHPYENFKATAEIITVMLRAKGLMSYGKTLSPLDVAQIMRLVKEARLFETPDHADSLVDICGYADCAQLVIDRETQ